MNDLIRFESLKKGIAEEKLLAAHFHDTFTNQRLKSKAGHLSSDCDEITVLLGAVDTYRPEAAERSHLDSIELAINTLLRPARQELQNIVDKYGAEAEMVG